MKRTNKPVTRSFPLREVFIRAAEICDRMPYGIYNCVDSAYDEALQQIKQERGLVTSCVMDSYTLDDSVDGVQINRLIEQYFHDSPEKYPVGNRWCNKYADHDMFPRDIRENVRRCRVLTLLFMAELVTGHRVRATKTYRWWRGGRN